MIAVRAHDANVEIEPKVYGLLANFIPVASTLVVGDLQMVTQR